MEDSATWSPIITLMQIYNKKERVEQKEVQNMVLREKSTWKFNAGVQNCAKRDRETEVRPDVH